MAAQQHAAAPPAVPQGLWPAVLGFLQRRELGVMACVSHGLRDLARHELQRHSEAKAALRRLLQEAMALRDACGTGGRAGMPQAVEQLQQRAAAFDWQLERDISGTQLAFNVVCLCHRLLLGVAVEMHVEVDCCRFEDDADSSITAMDLCAEACELATMMFAETQPQIALWPVFGSMRGVIEPYTELGASLPPAPKLLQRLSPAACRIALAAMDLYFDLR